MSAHVLAAARAAAARSEFLRSVASVRQDGGHRFALGEPRARRLTADEIEALEAFGNTADDWSRVRVADGFDERRVRGCTFHGAVTLGRFTGRVAVADGVKLPAGVYGSTVANAVLGHDCLVRDVNLLANYVVGGGAVVSGCGLIACEGETTFGNGRPLPLALEGGGRAVAAYAELTVEVAAAVARARGDRRFLEQYEAAVAEYAAAARSRRGVIGPGARVTSTRTVRNTFVGAGACVDGATLVADSTLLGGEDEPAGVASGACVVGSLLQWGSRAETMAVVERSVLTEHAHVGRHGKVTDSLLGPNTAVAAGEVTACLLGPFVACHHQSLLISTFWPAGRGNIAYGANVGSNHTSRAPDQEFWPGEGMFLGLGVNVKFPCDFSRAPYSIVACGVNLLSQQVTFPFSLIVEPAEHRPDVPPAYNQIVPGWVLAENLYALRRNEAKYKVRNKARRSTFDLRVFRPETVALVRDACRRLRGVRAPKEIYTERDIEGLGKNVLTEEHRRKAVEAYRAFLEYDALTALLERARAAPDVALLLTPSADPVWEEQRLLLTHEYGLRGVAAGLARLSQVLEAMARDVEASKAKDDARGARVIPDYAEAHAPADRDEWVRHTWEETRRLQAEIGRLLAGLVPGPAAFHALPAPANGTASLPVP